MRFDLQLLERPHRWRRIGWDFPRVKDIMWCDRCRWRAYGTKPPLMGCVGGHE